jgi:branched-chain amino acid transport system substrate-binding protein
MSMKKIVAYILVLLLAGIPVLTACSSGKDASPQTEGGNQSTPEPIKIGAIFPLSGSLALLGTESFEAADLARKMVNENGGVNGRHVEFVKADAPDATAAANEANRLITKEKVKMIIGTYSSGLSLAAIPVAERNEIPYLELVAGSDKINQQGFKYVFRSNENATDLGSTAVDFAVEVLAPKLNIDKKDLKVAVIHEDGAFGVSVAEAVKKRADEIGLSLAAYDNYQASSVDLSSLVLKLKDLNPDIVIATSYVNDAVLFIKQSKQYDFNPKAIIGTSAGYGLPDLADSLGGAVDGIFVTEAPALVNSQGLSEEAKKLDEEFRKRWKELKGREPVGHAYRAFSGTYALLTEILPKAQSVDDPKSIREAFLAVDLPKGSLPNGWGLKFLGENDPNAGLNEYRFAGVQQWINGSLQMVWPNDLATVEVTNVPLPAWKDRT